MSRLLGAGAAPPHAFGGPTWIDASRVETYEVVQVLDHDGRVYVELTLGHRDAMGTAYAALGWSMQVIARTRRY